MTVLHGTFGTLQIGSFLHHRGAQPRHELVHSALELIVRGWRFTANGFTHLRFHTESMHRCTGARRGTRTGLVGWSGATGNAITSFASCAVSHCRLSAYRVAAARETCGSLGQAGRLNTRIHLSYRNITNAKCCRTCASVLQPFMPPPPISALNAGLGRSPQDSAKASHGITNQCIGQRTL